MRLGISTLTTKPEPTIHFHYRLIHHARGVSWMTTNRNFGSATMNGLVDSLESLHLDHRRVNDTYLAQ